MRYSKILAFDHFKFGLNECQPYELRFALRRRLLCVVSVAIRHFDEQFGCVGSVWFVAAISVVRLGLISLQVGILTKLNYSVKRSPLAGRSCKITVRVPSGWSGCSSMRPFSWNWTVIWGARRRVVLLGIFHFVVLGEWQNYSQAERCGNCARMCFFALKKRFTCVRQVASLRILGRAPLVLMPLKHNNQFTNKH